jgi:hypothetical protein
LRVIGFLQSVHEAKQHLAEALQASQQPSAFQQLGATPQMPAQADPMQQMLMQQMLMGQQQGMMPQQQGMAPQQPMQQPMQQVPQQPMMLPQQLAKGGKVKAFWGKDPPDDHKPKGLSAKQKGKAKRRARAAGRPYPNLVDNAFAVRSKK